MKNHIQCYLCRKENNRVYFQRAWIPYDIANIENIVDLKDASTGEWSRGWTVLEVATTYMPSDFIAERTQDHKNMRKMTDI